MRAIIQRVLQASVERAGGDGEVNKIGNGLLVLLGIHRDDEEKDVDWMTNKLLKIKLFGDEDGGRWKSSVVEMDYEILCISQFTLYGTLKGAKPDFHYSMGAEKSQPMYERFLDRLGGKYSKHKIHKGFFGQRMLINGVFDGPVTITIDSPNKKLPPSLQPPSTAEEDEMA